MDIVNVGRFGGDLGQLNLHTPSTHLDGAECEGVYLSSRRKEHLKARQTLKSKGSLDSATK